MIRYVIVTLGLCALISGSVGCNLSWKWPDPPGNDKSDAGIDGGSDAGGKDEEKPELKARNPFTEGLQSPETIVSGRNYWFFEGPVYRPKFDDLLFSDIPAAKIYRLVLPGNVSVFREASNRSNGLTLDGGGRLLAAEQATHSVTRTMLATEEDTSTETLAVTYRHMDDTKELNAPNDLVVHENGTLFFTDPPYGRATPKQLPFHGVYRLDPNGTLETIWQADPTIGPNGIVLSPNQRKLYVGDSESTTVRVWDLDDNAQPKAEPRILIDNVSKPDGMCVDIDGNLYITTHSDQFNGVAVYSPTGEHWGNIVLDRSELPDDVAWVQATNCTFGGKDNRSLFITSGHWKKFSTVHRVRTTIPGA